MRNHCNHYLPVQLKIGTSLYRALRWATFLGLVMTVATPTLAAVKTEAYAEFLKGLNIVEQTQLTIFTDTQPPSKEEIIAQFNELTKKAQAELDSTDSDYAAALAEKRISIMRDLLFQTIEQYNDQYANYIYPDALKKYDSRRNGNFVGVGLKFRSVKDDYPVAIGALIGGPMDGKDIRPGDKLVSVDGKSLIKLSSIEIVSALKGPENSTATIEILRDGEQHTVNVNRSAVELHYSHATSLDKNIGYIKVSRFGSKTHIRVGKQLTQLIDQGATSFILDLRDNPGGSTRAARAIVSMFSKEQNIYCEKYKSDAVNQLPRHGEHLTDLPLAVLINRDSMSSSEIVAGAIKSYQRGIIIGSPSYGKGLIQKVFKLAEPLGGAVRTTIAAFGTPDHQPIHGAGIVPDIYVETDSDFMFQRTGSLNISSEARAFQRTLLERTIQKDKPERAQEHIAAKDSQLLTAIDQLQSLTKTQ